MYNRNSIFSKRGNESKYFLNNTLRLIGWVGLGAGVYGIASHEFPVPVIVLAFIIGVAATTANVIRVYTEAQRMRKKK